MSRLRMMYQQISAETAEMPYYGPCEAHMCAEQNAADTCLETGQPQCFPGCDVPSDEFIKHWFGSLQCILADSTPDAAVRDWFEARGVNY